MLRIQAFIKENPDAWETLLSSPPYSLKIKRKGDLVMFKYNQILSDFSLEIVKEARGLILDVNDWSVVSYPFRKFFNFGEPHADTIDWQSAVVTEKVDGSLITVYYHDSWRVATNGNIDAEDSELKAPPFKNFRQLFDAAAQNSGFDFDRLDKDCNYMFELRSPFNRIVVPYEDTKLIHLGTRIRLTLDEIEVDIGVEKPIQYQLSSLDDCIKMASTFDFTKEGFVVKDKFYHRIKVKSEDYLRVHRLANNGTMTFERAVEMIKTNETDEFLSYFPNYADYINQVRDFMDTMAQYVLVIQGLVVENKAAGKYPTRKDFAMEVIKNEDKSLFFLAYDNKLFDWYNNLDSVAYAKAFGSKFKEETND